MFSWLSSFKLYIYVALAALISSVICYLFYTLYQKEQELSDYREQVTQLEANNSILKGNLNSIRNTLESEKLQYKNYRELYSTADLEVTELRNKNRNLDKQNTAFNQKIVDIKRELTVAEAKVLEYQIPNAVIDAYSLNRMHNKQVTTP